jgi:DNA ligase 1
MLFKDLAHYFQKIETTTSRNTMIEILSELFAHADARVIDKIVYLMMGRVAPLYEAVEFGMADKMMLKTIALAYDVSPDEVATKFQDIGDLGKVSGEYAEKMRGKKKRDLSVAEVFETLEKVANTSGPGSVEIKMTLLSTLLVDLDPISAYFVSRIPVGKLRLGFSDMTVLDSLSWMIDGTKSHRKEIERAYNVHPDLGFIARQVKADGIEGLSKVLPVVGTPILMARAERLSSGDEIIGKIGTCAIESKFDGFRLQAHIDGKTVKLFTRNLEDATNTYPDVTLGLQTQLAAKTAILEGEAIAYNTDTGEYLPFQETVQRKRKHGIEEMAGKIPLKLICFELLYVDGESYIDVAYEERVKKLKSIIKKGDVLLPSEVTVADTGKEVETIFDDAISKGLEGILAKKLDGTYQAGARGWNWIKFKRSYSAHLDDTIDALVMGYYYGRGKRTSFGIGAFLIGIYDKKEDKFVTIARVGTGLTDDEWRELKVRGEKLKANEKPPLYSVAKALEPDVWIEPEIVVEIKADELTRSPVHTAGRVMKASKSGDGLMVDVPGYALRFPRLERFRDDKKFDDATTLPEIEDMFELQKKHLNKSSAD